MSQSDLVCLVLAVQLVLDLALYNYQLGKHCVDTVALYIEHVHVKYAASSQCLSRYSSQPYLRCKLATHQVCET